VAIPPLAVPKPSLKYARDYVVNKAKVCNYEYLLEMQNTLSEPELDLS